jgi:hypothetical protein
MIHERSYSTARALKTICAMQIREREDGSARMGLLAEIPAEPTPEVCGEGFNDRTVKVRIGERTYFVYRQDLEVDSEPVDLYA